MTFYVGQESMHWWKYSINMIFQKVVICIHIYHRIHRPEVIFEIDF